MNLSKKSIYLDYAAATPLDERVLKAIQPYLAGYYENPSATYLAGRAARKTLEDARAKIAGCLGSRPAEIIFTAGATEANNLTIQGVMRAFSGKEVLTSSIEHESVLAPARLFKNRQIPVSASGLIDPKTLGKMISDQTVLISTIFVNNELGSVQPLREIALLVKDIRKIRSKKGIKTPLYLHTDAAQAGNYFDLHVSRLGVDLMTINGGKLYGFKQTGALFVRAGTRLQPLILGGGQEFGFRSGTENVAGAVALAKALSIAQEGREKELKRTAQLRNFFANKLQTQIPNVVINGSKSRSSPHIINASFPGFDNERLMMELDEAGVQAAVGSACSAGGDEPSHVLSAIGLSDEQIRSSLRFSFGRNTTKAKLESVVEILGRLTS